MKYICTILVVGFVSCNLHKPAKIEQNDFYHNKQKVNAKHKV